MMHDPTYESPAADAAMVSALCQAIGTALERASIQDVTTTADILSALFTTLDHALRSAKANTEPSDAEFNTHEISRVLMEMLVEFGQVTKH